MKKCLRLVICLVIMQEICLMAGGACSTGNGTTVREPSSPRAQMYVVVENDEVGDYSQITDFQAHAAPAAVEPTKTRDSDEESIPQKYSPSDGGGVLINSVNKDNHVEPVPMDPEAIKKEEAVFLAASIKEKQDRRGTNLSNGTLSRIVTVVQSKPSSQLNWIHGASTVLYKPKDKDAFRLLKEMAGELATHREEAVEGKKDATIVAPTEATKESERPSTALQHSVRRRGSAVVVFDLD